LCVVQNYKLFIFFFYDELFNDKIIYIEKQWRIYTREKRTSIREDNITEQKILELATPKNTRGQPKQRKRTHEHLSVENMFHYPLVMGTYRHCHNPFQKITSTTRVI
jgi:hypothetical protein